MSREFGVAVRVEFSVAPRVDSLELLHELRVYVCYWSCFLGYLCTEIVLGDFEQLWFLDPNASFFCEGGRGGVSQLE